MIGEVEEKTQQSAGKGHDIQEGDRERVKRPREGNDAEQREPAEVGADQDWPAPVTIDKRTGVESGDERRHRPGGRQDRHLERRRIEREHRDEWEGQE